MSGSDIQVVLGINQMSYSTMDAEIQGYFSNKTYYVKIAPDAKQIDSVFAKINSDAKSAGSSISRALTSGLNAGAGSGGGRNKTLAAMDSQIENISNKVIKMQSDIQSALSKGFSSDRMTMSMSMLQSLIQMYQSSSTGKGMFFTQVQAALKDVNTQLALLKSNSSSVTQLDKSFDSLGKSLSKAKVGDDLIKQFTALRQQWAELRSNIASGKIDINSAEAKSQISAIQQAMGELQNRFAQTKLSGEQAGSGITAGMEKAVPSITKVVASLKGLWGALGGSKLAMMAGLSITQLAAKFRLLAKEAFNVAKEIESALAQLEIVTGASGSQLEVFFDRASEAAKNYGTTVSETLKSVEVFSRLGYDLQDALDLSSASTMLSNVAAVTVDEATTGLTAIIKGFGMEASDVEHVADVLTEVGQKYAISASELMRAFERGGAALAATGTSFEKSAAVFAAANAALQNAEMVGTSLKTVSARIRGAKSELVDLGEDYGDVAEGFSKYRKELMALTNVNGQGGFDIIADETTNTYKDIYEIFIGIAEVWDQLSDTTRARVAEILGGTRQLSAISSIISNIADAEGAYESAMNASGTAARANAIVMDTTEKKVQQLKTAFQVLSKDVFEGEFVKGSVSGLTQIVNVIDTLVEHIGFLPTAVGAANLGILIANLSKVTTNLKAFSTAYQAARAGGNGGTIGGMTLAVAPGTVGQSLSAGWGAMSNTAKMLSAIGGVTLAVTAVVAAYNLWKQHIEEVEKAADTASESYNSMASDISAYKEEIQKLKDTIASTSSSDEEAYAARQRLVEIQNTLIDNYGKEVEGINLIGDSAAESAAKLDKLTAAEAKRNLREGSDSRAGYDRAARKMESYYDKVTIRDDDGALYDQLQQIVDKYDVLSITTGPGDLVGPDANNTVTLTIDGDTTGAQQALEELYDVMGDIGNPSNSIGDVLDDIDDIVEEFGERYSDYMIQSIAADDTGMYQAAMESASSYMDGISDAIESQDWETLGQLIEDGVDLSEYIDDEDNPVRKYIERLISDATSKADSYQVQVSLDVLFDDKNSSSKSVVANIQKRLADYFTDSSGVVDVDLLKNMSLDISAGTPNQQMAFSVMSGLLSKYNIDLIDVVTHMQELGIITGNVAVETREETTAAKELDDVMKSLSSSISNAKSAMSQMLSGGGLNGETALEIYRELATAGERVNDYLSVQNGKIRLNTQAYLAFARAQAESDMGIQGLRDRRDTVGSIIASGSAIDTTQEVALRNEYNQLTAQIETYEAAIKEAYGATALFFDQFKTGTASLTVASDIMDAISTGGFSREQMLEWMQAVPELANYYDVASNSLVNVDAAMESVVASGYNEYIRQINEELATNTELTDAERIQLVAMAEAYEDAAKDALYANKALGLIRKGTTGYTKSAKNFKKAVSNLWNADQFSDARQDLVKLAKESGITKNDILDLAKSNEYLAALMMDSGVSAEYLAEIFERLSLVGAGALDDITDDTMKLSIALSEMSGPLAKAQTAFEKYQSTLGSWEYDDAYTNYQEAYKSLGEMFENGTFGADFYRTIDYLYGEGHGADGVEALYQQYKKLGDLFYEDDNGLGFLEKLYDNQDLLDGLKSSVTLDDNGNYIWDIKPEDFDDIAAAFGTTEEAVAACVEALGMFGDFTEYDPRTLVDTIKSLDIAVVDLEGNATVSEQALRSMLESIGMESWQIDQIIAKMKEFGDIDFVDASEATAAIDQLAAHYQALTGKEWNFSIDSSSIDEANRKINALEGFRASLIDPSTGEVYVGMEDSYNACSTLLALLQADKQKLVDESAITINTSQLSEADAQLGQLLMDYQNAALTLDTSDASTKLSDIASQIGDIPDSVKTELGVDPDTTTQEILDGIAEGSIKVTDEPQWTADFQQIITTGNTDLTVNVHVNDDGSLQTLSDAVSSLENKNVIITAIPGGQEGVQALSDAIDTVEEKEVSVAATTSGKGDVDGLTKSIKNVPNKKANVSAIVSGTNNVTSLFKAIRSLPARTNPVINALVSGMQAIKNLAAAIASLRSKTIYVTTVVNKKSRVNGTANVNGTARAGGSARASGYWGTSTEETALVGELGREIIVDPNTGTWQTVGDAGAQFVTIPKGAIVFNHKQSEALLKYGRVAGRGRAYATGTVSRKNPATGSTYTSNYTSSKSWDYGSSATAVKSSSKSGSSSQAADAAEEFAEDLDWIEILLDRIQRRIGSLSTVASSAFTSFSRKASTVKEEMAAIRQEISYQQQAYNEYMRAAETVDLSAHYKELVRNGTIALETITDEDLNNAITKYKELVEKAYDCRDAIVDLHENLAQLYQDNFDNVSSQFDHILNTVDAKSDRLNRIINDIENTGNVVSKGLYESLIAVQQERIGTLSNEYKQLTQKLNEGIQSGTIDEYSESWYQMKEAIQEVQVAMEECNSEIISLRHNIRELEWERFDNMRDAVEDLNEEAEFYIDILSRGDMFTEKGMFNDVSNAVMGLHVQEYATNMDQIAKYGEEIVAIQKELAKDQYNKELVDRRNELVEAQQKSVEALYDERDAMVSLVEEGIKAQLSYLRDLIDTYAESLDSAKDLYDYQKKLSSQTQKIGSIQKQIQAYAGDTSEETRLTVQKLRDSLKEAQDDLNETQYDRYVSDQKKLLDDLYDNYEKVLYERLDDVDALIKELIATTNTESESIRKTIGSVAADTGIAVGYQLNDIWTKLGGEGGKFDIFDTINTSIHELTGLVRNEYNKGATEGLIAQMKQNSLDWFTASKETQSVLSEQNKMLASNVSTILGDSITSKNGTWYNSRNESLYTLSKKEIGDSIVDKMRSNSRQWATASDAKRQEIAQENATLGARYQSVTGTKTWIDANGVWYTGNGQLLYDVAGTPYNFNKTEVKNIVDRMKANSAKWHNADPVERSRLATENTNYGAQIQELTGNVVYRDNAGVWWYGNKKLYDVFHQGGIVGGGTSKDYERLAILKQGEAVLTSKMWENLSKTMPTLPSGTGSGNPGVSNTTMNISLPGVKNYQEFVNELTTDKRFEKFIQSISVDQIAGGSSLAKNKYTW